MQANSDKTKYMEIYFGTVPLTMQHIVINDSEIDEVTVFKLLGLMTDSKLSKNKYVDLCMWYNIKENKLLGLMTDNKLSRNKYADLCMWYNIKENIFSSFYGKEQADHHQT